MVDFLADGVTVGADGVTSGGDIAAAGKDISGATATMTGAISGSDMTATGLITGKQAAIEQMFAPAAQADALSLYVDGAAGDDGDDGTVGNPVLTMDRLAELVPNNGYCFVYVTGDPTWAGGGAFPYQGYQGHLRIFSVDAVTVIGAADVIAAYGSGTGSYGRDQVTPTVLVPNDATDRSRFLILTDDGAAQHIVRIQEVVGGLYETEAAGLTITGANAVSLVEMTSTLAPAAAVYASPMHHEGDVQIIGFNVTSPGENGLTGFGFAACVIDASAHVTALNLGYNATLGGITIDDTAGPLAPAAYCPSAALTGTNLEDLVNGVYIAGDHLTMAGGASLLRLISASAPGCGRVMGTVWEAGDIYVGNPEAFLLMTDFRGVLAASGLQVMDGAQVRMGDGQLGDLVQSADAQIALTGEITPTSVNHEGGIKAAGTGGNESIGVEDAAKAGGSDTVAFRGGKLSKREGITITGNMWDAATAQELVQLDGVSENCRFTLGTPDCGAGDMVSLLGGDHDFGACTGDNSNVGGTGLSINGLGTTLSVDNGFAITGNGGGTTTIGIGIKGHVALPGAGTVENDFTAAGAVGGNERLCVFEHRA